MAEEDLFSRFRRLASEPEPDLLEGALLISELIDPAEDLASARRKVEELAARVTRLREAGAAGLDALRRVIFEEEKFHGDAETYGDPSNSSIARVLRRRRGMPITLSILLLEVGRRSGLALEGVGLPGHFVVGGPELPAETYLDAFVGGELCDREVLARRVASIFGSPVALPDAAFAGVSSRAILTRVLLNLRSSYEQRDRFEEALEALRFADALEPDEPAYLRERGILLLKVGRSAEALSLLDRYVREGTGSDVPAIQKLIEILREQAEGGAEHLELRPARKRTFKLEEARALLPRVQQITSDAVLRYARLEGGDEAEEERVGVVRDWAREVVALGAEIKGLWLVDFDSGAGYYCWKYPEPALEYFHGYEEGFAGRLPLQ